MVAGTTRGQGLSVLIGASVMLSLAMGMRQSLGLFMAPVTKDLALTASDFAFAIAIQNIVWGAAQPVVGAIADRWGIRPVALFGAVVYAAGLAATAWGGALGLLLGSGVCIGVALASTASSIAMSAAARIATPATRSMVLGIVSAAGSLGTFFAAPLAQGLISSQGWQLALIGFIGLAAAMVPAAFFAGSADKMKVAASPAEQRQTLGEALQEAFGHGGYCVMAAAFFVCGLQLVFITTHLPTYLQLCGLDPMLSAQALATIGIFNVGGSYLFGWLGDRYPKQVLLGGVYLLRSAFLAAYFLMPASTASTLVFAAAMGTLWLGVVPLVNGLVAQIFGLRYMATLSGVAFFSHQVGSFLGAWGGARIYDGLGSYDRAWQFAVVVGVIAGIAQIFMNDRPTARLAAAPA